MQMLGVELLLPDVSCLFFFRSERTKGTTAQLDDILILKQRSNKVTSLVGHLAVSG